MPASSSCSWLFCRYKPHPARCSGQYDSAWRPYVCPASQRFAISATWCLHTELALPLQPSWLSPLAITVVAMTVIDSSLSLQLHQRIAVRPLFLPSCTDPMLSQVFTMQQAAKVVIHCDPEVTLITDPLDHIAHHYGFPTKQQIISNAPEGLNKAEWRHFWSYAETISPYLSLRSEYIPIGAMKPPATAQLLLY